MREAGFPSLPVGGAASRLYVGHQDLVSVALEHDPEGFSKRDGADAVATGGQLRIHVYMHACEIVADRK